MPTCIQLDSVNMDRFKLRRYGYHSCVVRCRAMVKVEEGRFATERFLQPLKVGASAGKQIDFDLMKAGAICMHSQTYTIDKAPAGQMATQYPQP